MQINYLKIAENQVREADPDTTFKRTDLGNAERLVHRYGDIIRFCPARNKWLLWNDTHWEWDDIRQIEVLAKGTSRHIIDEAESLDGDTYKEVLSHAMRSESAARIRSMIELAKSEKGIPIKPGALDGNPWLLNVKNGTLDLRTGELRAPYKEDLITRIIDVNYDPDAQCHTWQDFLHKVMAGNENLMIFLQRVTGYSLTGDTREQC